MGNEYFRNADIHDMDFLFHLVNDEECRKNSFHSNIITYLEHKDWFNKKLSSQNCKLFIYMGENGQKIGQARLDFDRSRAYISYSILKEYRGQGYGKKIIEQLEEELKKYKKINEVYAQVRINNEASKRIFEHLGYQGLKKDNHIDYVKSL